MSDLDQILSDETDMPEEDQVEQVTDEAPEGAPKEEPDETPDAAEEPKKEEQAEPQMVPLGALEAVRGEVRALKQQLVQRAEQPKPAPDIFEDPDGFTGHLGQVVQSQVTQARLDMSEVMARQQYGDEEVNAAFSAIEAAQDRAAYQQIMASKHPWAELVGWHKRARIATEIGNDPDGWKERQRTAIRAEVEAELKSQMVAESVTNIGKAPSLASEPNLGTRAAPAWGGPTSLDDILG